MMIAQVAKWGGVLLLTAVVGCDNKNALTSADLLDYTISVGDSTTTITYPSYEVSVRQGNPFGIVSLEVPGQFGNFSHERLPLGDWEWFWYDRDGRDNDEKRIKLLEPMWASPKILESKSGVQLQFEKSDAVLPGLSLEVQFFFKPDGIFSISYLVENNTGMLLPKPYVMVGFPGFTNHRWVNAVGTRLGPYFPKAPYLTFWEEAVAGGLPEYTIGHDESSTVGSQALKGLVAISMFGRSYVLQAKYSFSESDLQVSSAHVNKPGYLTSHLYVLMKDLPTNTTARVIVNYQITSTMPR